METNYQSFKLLPIAMAVRAVLLGVVLLPLGAAQAEGSSDDNGLSALVKPSQTVDFGVGTVNSDAIKAHEYDGFQREGRFGLFDFELRGGGDYDSNSATRYRISGTNLGQETRSIQTEYGEQGRFRLSAGFDELIRAGSAVYQTMYSPYQGVGTNSLTLPSNWSTPMYTSSATMGSATAYPNPSASMLGLGATSLTSPLISGATFICKGTTVTNNAACGANSALGGVYTAGFPGTNPAYANMMAQNLTDLSDFQNVRLSTRRDKQKYAANYIFSPNWSLDVGMQREAKNGLKPLGVVNSANGGSATENSVIIPELINTLTDQYNVAFNYKSEKAFASFTYFGEIFDNHAKSMTVGNPYATNLYAYTLTGASPYFSTLATLSTAYGVSSATITEEPNNTYNQFRLAGGYQLTHSTKLTADVSYGRNAQNDSYILDPAIFSTATGLTNAALNNGSSVPVNSANALVITKGFDFKLSSHITSKLSLDAAYKYDVRDNQTPVHTYMWYDAGVKESGTASGVLNGATIPGIASGTPIYSGVNIVANRPYSKRVNQLDIDADYKLTRTQSFNAGVQWQGVDRWCNGTWMDCSFADSAKETTSKFEYKFVPTENLRGRLALDVSSRHVDYNPNAWMSLAPALGATNIASLNTPAIGYSGSVLGFLQSNGLSAYGLPIAANGSSGLTGQSLAVYNLLYGTGNGGLSNTYYGINNVTQNWPGLDIYSMANRNRNRLRGSLNWQANERFSVQTSADYRQDKYPDDVYGLQDNKSWTLNLDGDFQATDTLSITGFYTHDDQRSNAAGNSASNGSVSAVTSTVAHGGTAYTTVTGATGYNTTVSGGCLASADATGLPSGYTQYQLYQNNAKIAPCTQWQSQIHDRGDTIGLTFTKARLLSERFNLKGDLSFTRSITGNRLDGGNYVANPLAAYLAGTPAVYYVNASSMPDVTVSSLQIHLAGDYRVTPSSNLRISYGYVRMQTTDYTYQSTQAVYTSSSVMPVMAPAPSASVSMIGISYSLKVQ